MPECSKSRGVVLCWVNEEEADGGPALPFTRPLTSVLCFYDGQVVFHASPVVAMPHSRLSGSSCSQPQSSPRDLSCMNQQACISGWRPCTGSTEPLSWALCSACYMLLRVSEDPFSVLGRLPLGEGLSRGLETFLAQSFFTVAPGLSFSPFHPPFHPTVLCHFSCAPCCLSFPTRRYCENWSMCRCICGRR